MQINCLKCSEQILHPARLGENAISQNKNDPPVIKNGDNSYYVCPHCKAKNGVTYSRGKDGKLGHDITHLIE